MADDDDDVIHLVTCHDSIQTGQQKRAINRDGLKSGLMMTTTTAPSNDLFVIRASLLAVLGKFKGLMTFDGVVNVAGRVSNGRKENKRAKKKTIKWQPSFINFRRQND